MWPFTVTADEKECLKNDEFFLSQSIFWPFQPLVVPGTARKTGSTAHEPATNLAPFARTLDSSRMYALKLDEMSQRAMTLGSMRQGAMNMDQAHELKQGTWCAMTTRRRRQLLGLSGHAPGKLLRPSC